MRSTIIKNKVSILKNITVELNRFQKRLALAIVEQETIDNCSSRHYAASKRGALDLKNELTKLTQDTKHIYKN